MSADTIVPNPQDPQSLNRYSYTQNNPVKFRDPSGHMMIYGGSYEPYGDGWYVRMNPEAPGCQSDLEFIKQGSSLAVDFVPIIGDLKGLAEVATGRDLITGEDLGKMRWAGLFGLIGLAEIRRLDDAGEAFRLLFKVEDTVEVTGQWHHVLPTKVVRALERHPALGGIFKRNDFLVQAIDKAVHSGYQTWHRAYDDEIVSWLADPANAKATEEEFLQFLLEIYSRPDMIERFPGAVDLLNQALEAVE